MRRGGLYVWRTDKPHALIGLPFIGRHFAYTGMTNSYYHREAQHLQGSVTYGTLRASWSDLRPKCYRILPLPGLITHGRHRRKIMKALETLMIYALCPVYNDKQQAPWNLRRKSRQAAARERARRDLLGFHYRMMKFILRMIVMAGLWAAVIYGLMQVR